PEERGREQWARDVTPVMTRTTSEALGRLAPLRADAVHSGQEDEDHQRDLEVQVNDLQPPQVVEPDAPGIEIQMVLGRPEVDKAGRADGGDERERERHAPELCEDAGR